MTQPRPDREDLRKRVAALPLVESGEILDERSALAAYEDLKRSGSQLPEHIGRIITIVVGEVSEQLDETDDHEFHLTASNLRAIIARAAIRGAAQTASDLGHTQLDINRLHSMFPEIGAPMLSFPEPHEPETPPPAV